MPGGYNQVAVPMFTNHTTITGAEVYFTKALTEEVARSSWAHLRSANEADVVLHGTLSQITTTQGTQVTSKELPGLPDDTVLAREYHLRVHVHLTLIQHPSKKVLWEGDFHDEERYPAAQVMDFYAANPLYNKSMRQLTLQALAEKMMREAYAHMTEQF